MSVSSAFMCYLNSPGRLQCLIGHLAENEVRGELTFLEKAQGICVARSLYEETLGKNYHSGHSLSA